MLGKENTRFFHRELKHSFWIWDFKKLVFIMVSKDGFRRFFLGEDPRKEEGKFSRKVFKEKKRGGSKIMDYSGDLLRSLLILSKFLV